MLKCMLDTNIVIYTIKNRPMAVKEAFQAHYGQMCISKVTLMELIYGAEKSAAPGRNLLDVEGFAARLDVLDYDGGRRPFRSASRRTGEGWQIHRSI